MEAFGYTTFNIGPEPEFFMFRLNENEEPTLTPNDDGGYFDLAPTDLGENCRHEIVLELEELGFEVEASHHENAPGQHEIDFKYEDALTACDNIQTFKLVVKTVARKHNLHATFMPKPLSGVSGSGMHCNLSLFTKDGNAFFDKNGSLELSDDAYHFLAGIMDHAVNFTAVTNPTVNSYKRLVPGFEAPCYVAWSAKNRSPLVRIPTSRGLSTRIEVRSVDPTANPYLTMAVLLKAGLEGIKQRLTPVAPVNRNIYEMTKEERCAEGIIDLPTSLGDAINLLKKDQVIISALGEHIYTYFLKLKDIEWKVYEMQVHPWERETYMKMF